MRRQGAVAKVDDAVVDVEQVGVRVELLDRYEQIPLGDAYDREDPADREQARDGLEPVGVDVRLRFGGVQVDDAESHRFADDGFGDRYPPLAVELHPSEAPGDQESALQVRVGDVLTDVCVIEARRPAGRCLGVGNAGGLGVWGRLRLLGFLGFLGLRPERIAVVCVDQLVARLGPFECVSACRGVEFRFGDLAVGLLAQLPTCAEQNLGVGEVVAILEESTGVCD